MDALAVRGPEKPVGLGIDVGPIGSPGIADDKGRGPRADAELVVQAQEIRVVGAERPDFGLEHFLGAGEMSRGEPALRGVQVAGQLVGKRHDAPTGVGPGPGGPNKRRENQQQQTQTRPGHAARLRRPPASIRLLAFRPGTHMGIVPRILSQINALRPLAAIEWPLPERRSERRPANGQRLGAPRISISRTAAGGADKSAGKMNQR